MKWKLILVSILAFFFGIPLLLGCRTPPANIEPTSLVIFVGCVLNYWITILQQLNSEILIILNIL